jgi:4-amino-4-deoxy-L-arabinose transferase-like glycosyltransferase
VSILTGGPRAVGAISAPPERERRRIVVTWQLAIRLVAPLGALLLEGVPALIGAVLVQEAGLWIAGRLVRPCQRRFARNLFLAAYGLRVAIVLVTHYVAKQSNGNGALFRDDYTNDLVGEWLVRIARGDVATAIFAGHQYLLSSAYTYLLMGIYALFGYTPILPKLLNAGLAALCAVLTFDIARRVFSARVATVAALGMALLPSLIVWSVATLKETLVLFVSLAALRILQYLAVANRRDRRVWDALVVLLGVTLLLLDLRSSSAFLVVGLLGMLLVGRSHVRLRPWQMALAGVAVAGLLVGGLLVVRVRTSNRPLGGTLEDIALQIRHRRAQEAAGAASQLRSEQDVPSLSDSPLPSQAEAASDAAPFSPVGDVLDPLGYALLAPTPWQAQTLSEQAASAEMLVWYVLLIGALFAWRAAPRQRLFTLVLIAYGVANWLILAAVEGNVGNLLRHRLMLSPILLILGLAGLEYLWLRLRPYLPDQQRSYAKDERAPG